MVHEIDVRTQKRVLPPLLSLTQAAADRLHTLYEAASGRTLRVSVNGKGCAGMSYDIAWVGDKGPGDEVVTDRGVSFFVDRKATLFLVGSVMDFEVKNLSSTFTFKNPNETSRCGCGESFSA